MCVFVCSCVCWCLRLISWEEEAVTPCDRVGPTSSRWQEGVDFEGCVCMCVVILSADGSADAVCGVNVYDEGKRDPDDPLSYTRYLLQGLEMRDDALFLFF